jgi:hypothetical protein
VVFVIMISRAWVAFILGFGIIATGWSSDPLRFALLSDPHVTRGTKEDQPFYRGRLESVIAAVNAEQVSFVLIAGDLTQDGKPEAPSKGVRAKLATVPTDLVGSLHVSACCGI